MTLSLPLTIALALSPPPWAQTPEGKTAVPGLVAVAPVSMPILVGGPTTPTLVALDFKDQPVAQVVRVLTTRTGGLIDVSVMNDPAWNDQRVTLESPAPVPFWEAIDRLSTASRLTRSLTGPGLFGNPRSRVQLNGSVLSGTIELGPASYVGPFRLGPVTVHEHFDRVFLATRTAPGTLDTTPPSFYAEIALLAEPRVLYIRTNPMTRLVALDDQGQSLLDPSGHGAEPGFGVARIDHREPKSLRVPLARPAGPSKALATLRGQAPLEVARRPASPTTVVPLDGSVGKTFRDGDVAITVREFGLVEGRTTVKFSARIEGKRGQVDRERKELLNARLWSIAYDQIELVDAEGKPVNGGGGGGPTPAGEMNFDYSYTAFPAGSKGQAPTHLRIYRPDWVAWDLPFEFNDLPLP